MARDVNQPLAIRDLLTVRSGPLSGLHARIAQSLDCQRRLRENLGPPMSEHLHVVNIRDNTLTLYTDSPAWASRLRFNIQNILDIARQHCGLDKLNAIRIKVMIQNSEIKPVKRAKPCSDRTAKLIESTAQSMPDQKLRLSLSNLAKRRSGS
jgi:hypothetical protein